MFRRDRSTSRRPNRAFTLVELLVVIGIIAVLIAILLPALSRAKSQATAVACLANLRSIGQAITIYAGQHKGSLPYGYWDGRGKPDGVNQGSSNVSSDWALLLLSSALGKGGNTYGTQEGSDRTKLQDAFACPAASTDSSNPIGNIPRKLHYSSHPRLMPNLDDYDLSRPARPLLQPWKMSKVRRSSEIILIFDGAQVFNSNYGNAFAVGNGLDQDGLYRGDTQQGRSWNYLLTKPGLDLGAPVFTTNKDAQVGGAGVASIRWRHGKNDLANFVFADGHAEGRRLKFGSNAELKLRNVYLEP